MLNIVDEDEQSGNSQSEQLVRTLAITKSKRYKVKRHGKRVNFQTKQNEKKWIGVLVFHNAPNTKHLKINKAFIWPEYANG